MKITMCYTGVLAAAGGASGEGIDIAEDKTLESLLHQVADRRGSDVARHLFNEQGDIQTGRMLYIDTADMNIRKIEIRRRPDCDVCGTEAT